MTALPMIQRLAIAALALSLGACVHSDQMFAPAVRAGTALNWQAIATDDDRERLRGWRDTWLAALDEARTAGAAGITRSDKLFQPDVALDHALPPAGDYHCRTYSLGSRRPSMPAFSMDSGGRCRIAAFGPHLHLTRLDGQQRPDGLLFTGGAAQAVFLGTLLLSDEAAPIPYGEDDRRDMIGVIDRVGDGRWRIAIPDQALGPKLQLIELTPAGN